MRLTNQYRQLFLQLKSEAYTLGKYQRLISLSSTKLGGSYYDVIERIETLNEVDEEPILQNIKGLIGDFIPASTASKKIINNPEYKLLGDYYIKPTTTEGSVLIESLDVAQAIMEENFPYSYSYLDTLSRTILRESVVNITKLSSFEKKRLRRLITTEFKNFINSTEDSKLFVGDIKNIRKHFFFDFEGGESLGHFIRSIREHPIIHQNSFLQSLEVIAPKSPKEPTIIRSVTDENKVFETEDIYEDFLQLLQDDTTILGTWKKRQITPKKLAQYLATYSQLSEESGGVYGFRKAIHLAYLDTIGHSKYLRDINKSLISKSVDTSLNNFAIQFFQHNPEEAFTITKSDLSSCAFTTNPKANAFINQDDNTVKESNFKNFMDNLEYFTIPWVVDVTTEDVPNVIAFRSFSGRNNKPYKLFLYNRNTNRYERIGLLGSRGYYEYDMTTPLGMSNIFTEQNKYSKAHLKSFPNPFKKGHLLN